MIGCLLFWWWVWWVLRKPGVNEWLVKIVQLICRNTRSRVTVNGFSSDGFFVQEGLRYIRAQCLGPCYLSFCWKHYLEKLGQDV